MRLAFAAVTFACLCAASIGTRAETKIFLVENQRDGYGVDQCLAAGANCGKPIARAYCQARQFNAAVSFHKIDHDDITGGVGSVCHGATCSDYVAIECSR